MEDAKEKLALSIASKIIKKEVDPHVKKIQKKTQGMALDSLEQLGIEEDIANKGMAALAIGKAVAEKKMKIKIADHVTLDVDANKDKEKIGLFYNKGF